MLASPEYGQSFATEWVNVFKLTTLNQRKLAFGAWHEWLAGSLNAGRPWDAIIRDTMTAIGPVTESPPGQFYYFNANMNGKFESKILAGNIGQVFLGVQLQCAECHDHPFSDWKQSDFWGIAAFFAPIMSYEKVENNRTPGVMERHLEVKKGKKVDIPKAIATSIPNDGEARNGGTKVPAAFLDGRPLTGADPAKSHRLPFAEWLTSPTNPYFARTYVNRVWGHFFARGLVHPLNEFSDYNPPSHPALLDLLTAEFVASGFDHKHLIRCLCLSEAYQRSSLSVAGNEEAEDALFARMAVKVVPAEVLYDSLCRALEVSDLAPPADPRAKKPNSKAPPPPPARDVFLASFRNAGEGDDPAELKTGVPHALRLMNQQNFNTGGQRVDSAMAAGKTPDAVVEWLFLATLSREPTAEELALMVSLAAKQKTPRDGYCRVLWVLVNSPEFALNH